MKRKVLKIGVIITFACFGMVAVADTTVITAPPLGEGGGSSSVTRPLLQNQETGAYYCGCTCTTTCGAICK